MARKHIKQKKCPNCGGDLVEHSEGTIFYECEDCGEAYGYRSLLLAGQKSQGKLEDFG